MVTDETKPPPRFALTTTTSLFTLAKLGDEVACEDEAKPNDHRSEHTTTTSLFALANFPLQNEVACVMQGQPWE